MTTEESMVFETPDQGEEAARAELYGLLATLLYAPPTQTLLDAIAAAAAPGSTTLELTWNALSALSREASQEGVRDEYEQLFIGVGKPEVMLYGSFYLSGFLMEKPLAELRTDLAQLGLERSDVMVESEDHLAALCEVMRHLILSDDIASGNLAVQCRFFNTHMRPWILDCCDAIDAHPRARFYKEVARLARQFFEVEMQAFDMA